MDQRCASLSGSGMIFTGKAWISARMARAWWRQKNTAPSIAAPRDRADNTHCLLLAQSGHLLPLDHPMVAPYYIQRRSDFAKKIGLGKGEGRKGKKNKKG
jgi:hypothetical protein